MRFVIIGVAVFVGVGLAAFGGMTAFGVGLPKCWQLRRQPARPRPPGPRLRRRLCASHQTKRMFQRRLHFISLRNRRRQNLRQGQLKRCRHNHLPNPQVPHRCASPKLRQHRIPPIKAPPQFLPPAQPRPRQPHRRRAAYRPATSRAGWDSRALSKSTPRAAPDLASNISSNTISSATRRSC